MARPGGYAGKVLRVDLSNERLADEQLDEATLRKCLGGTALGVKILYDEVPGGIEWSDPGNRLIFAPGVLTGTGAPGSANFTVATKGPLTNFLSCSQANGFFGPRLKFAGYDAIVAHGAAKRWVYLYVHGGVAELRDAAHLVGKDTWETDEMLSKEIGERQLSVSCIGPAGENLVKHAAIFCDRGHVCSSNGPGAVMGSKKLKAIAVCGRSPVAINDKPRFKALVEDWWKQAHESLWGRLLDKGGTCGQYSLQATVGMLPVKNYQTNIFPDHPKFSGESLRANYKLLRRTPCYACRLNHLHDMEFPSGPHKGEVFEEPEYEAMAAFSSMIANTDVDAALWLTHLNDRLGMDAKEQAALLGLAMECYEKGLITQNDTGGVELTWGNVQAVETILHKIATRDGFGDVLAEGVVRAAQRIGGDAPKFAVYTHKGIAPNVVDIRTNLASVATAGLSDFGSIPAGMGDVGEYLPKVGEGLFAPPRVMSAKSSARGKALLSRRGILTDSLGVCMFTSSWVRLETMCDAVSAVTGWDFSWKEGAEVGERSLNLQRAFNLRHGYSRDHDSVSQRIREAPRDGPAQGMSVGADWEATVDAYYEAMGWDKEGRPLPETLRRLDLESVIQDLNLKGTGG